MTKEQTSEGVVKSTLTAFSILEALDQQGESGVTELADALGFSKSTVHRHLSTLVTCGYVIKTKKGYRLGLQFMQLAEGGKDHYAKLFQVAKPEIEEFAEETGETAKLWVEEQGRCVLIYITRGESSVMTDIRVGKRLEIHTTAAGKALLAQMPAERAESIIDRYELTEHTEHTITDKGALLEQLDTIREHGYAFDHEERIEGTRCVAVPINTESDYYAAFSMGGSTKRLHGEYLTDEIPHMLTQYGREIELNLRYSEY